MADIKQIQFKRTSTAGKKPLPADLAQGEIAINLADRVLFTKDANNAIIDLGFAKGGTVDGDVTINGATYIKELTIGNIIPVANGGTGSATKDGARLNLDAAKSGVNSDITGLMALVGPLKLGSDPVGATDATTKRYVDNLVAAGGGGSGATMNGIMNYGVGTPVMAASRAFIQQTEVTQDGQLLNRADFPELWVFAQMTTPISDVDWLADPEKRGAYSTGDGITTFRVPDWNGVQPGSIQSAFFRGGNGTTDMKMQRDAAPNITGSKSGIPVTLTAATGAFKPFTQATGTIVQGTGGVVNTFNLEFDASRSNAAYGRDDSTEVRPNNISGVWCVRAKGGFIATNTSWSVMNSVADATSGQIVLGGKIISSIEADDKTTTVSIEAEKAVDLTAAIRFAINNPDSTNQVVWRMEETGQLVNTVANAGTNTNITSMSGLIGALRLGGDPVQPGDATTKRYVDNAIAAGGSGGGATMSGIMNFGIGSPQMAASRAFIMPSDLPQDGQLVNRADYPELWAFAQLTNIVTDTVWIGQVNNRGRYSSGNGTTTFRVPDWNGVQSGSIPNLFFRGTNSSNNDGFITNSGVPNVKGSFNPIYPGVSQIPADGYFGITRPMAQESAWTNPGGQVIQGSYQRGLTIDLSLGHTVYQDGIDEVRPRNVAGVWVVRAKGSFKAADTSWSVYNGVTAAPATGAPIAGGEIKSVYMIGDKPHVSATMRVAGTYTTDGWVETSIKNEEIGAVTAIQRLHGDGRLVVTTDRIQGIDQIGPQIRSYIQGGSTSGMYAQSWANGRMSTYIVQSNPSVPGFGQQSVELSQTNDLILQRNMDVIGNLRGGAFVSRAADRYATVAAYDTTGIDGGAVLETGGNGANTAFYFFATGGFAGGARSSSRGNFMFEGSDSSWKKNIIDIKSGSRERVEAMKLREYEWINGGEHERGWIAQEMQAIDPQYVSEYDGKLSVSTKAVVADVIKTVQELSEENKQLKAQIAEIYAMLKK